MSSRKRVKTSRSRVRCVISVRSSLFSSEFSFLNAKASFWRYSSSSSRKLSSRFVSPPLNNARRKAFVLGLGRLLASFSSDPLATASCELGLSRRQVPDWRDRSIRRAGRARRLRQHAAHPLPGVRGHARHLPVAVGAHLSGDSNQARCRFVHSGMRERPRLYGPASRQYPASRLDIALSLTPLEAVFGHDLVHEIVLALERGQVLLGETCPTSLRRP